MVEPDILQKRSIIAWHTCADVCAISTSATHCNTHTQCGCAHVCRAMYMCATQCRCVAYMIVWRTWRCADVRMCPTHCVVSMDVQMC